VSAPLWLQAILADPGVTDICLNGAGEAFADRGRGLEPVPESEWAEVELRNWVLDQLATIGKTWDAKHPFVDAVLPSGHRLHVAFPPVARRGILVSLRSLRLACPDAAGELGERWGEFRAMDRLLDAVRSGDSILISGATGSGKTTLANDLLGRVPEHERVIALEDTPELWPAHPHFLSLTSRPPNADGFGEVTLRALLRQTLRMRPDRIILGECRGAEVLDLLQALNTGHRGAMATLHANSPRDALRRIELLCLLASGGTIPVPVIRELLVVGIRWIVQVERHGASRRITELWRIEGREGDTVLMRPVLDSHS
jgi:pilus assembly protein CpaF